MRENRVSHALCVSVSLDTLSRVIALAQEHENLFASVGIHPEHKEARDATVDQLVELARHRKVVAIGETGLDYYWHKGELEWQRQRFRRHIRAARACGKPLIIHMRDAAKDTLAIMAEEGAARSRRRHALLHRVARRGRSGAVAGVPHLLFRYRHLQERPRAQGSRPGRAAGARSHRNRRALSGARPYRGKTNEPAYVRHVAEELARLRGIEVEAVAEATSGNFFRLFSIPHPLAVTKGGAA